MAFLIGTDEAGYGPNLGPLVVTASVWRVPALQGDDLYTRLEDAVCKPHVMGGNESSEQILIGDSKDLYQPGKGLARLEQGVLACLAAAKKRPRTWRKIWTDVAKPDSASISALPWYRDFDDRLPLELPARQIRDRADRLLANCRAADCELRQIRSRVVLPSLFNDLCETHGNKASALSHTTLQLIRSVVSGLPENEQAFILCDKHGGRNKYGPLLHAVFPESLAMVRSEGRQESVYDLGSKDCMRRIAFRAKADESFLPAALASMVSKYLRELAMRAFNAFWTSRVPELKPTAGYPVDAKRFKQQIAGTQQKLGIDDHDLWRSR